MTVYLRFDNNLAVEEKFSAYLGPKKQVPSYIKGAAVQVLGYVKDNSGDYFDGYLVMISKPIPEFAAYEFKPDFPVQSFGPVPVEVKSVPFEIARWQAKMTLIMTPTADGSNLWQKVLDLRDAEKDPKMQVAMDAALYDVLSWQRASVTVGTVAVAIGLTDEQVDDLFIAASKLVL